MGILGALSQASPIIDRENYDTVSETDTLERLLDVTTTNLGHTIPGMPTAMLSYLPEAEWILPSKPAVTSRPPRTPVPARRAATPSKR